MGVPHKSDKRLQCIRLPTHQPCFHKFASWGASKATYVLCLQKQCFVIGTCPCDHLLFLFMYALLTSTIFSAALEM